MTSNCISYSASSAPWCRSIVRRRTKLIQTHSSLGWRNWTSRSESKKTLCLTSFQWTRISHPWNTTRCRKKMTTTPIGSRRMTIVTSRCPFKSALITQRCLDRRKCSCEGLSWTLSASVQTTMVPRWAMISSCALTASYATTKATTRTTFGSVCASLTPSCQASPALKSVRPSLIFSLITKMRKGTLRSRLRSTYLHVKP